MGTVHDLYGGSKMGDNGGNQPPPTDMETRVAKLEELVAEARERFSKIETRLDGIDQRMATKADLHKEINAQTWKLVTFVCGFGTALAGAVYFIATHVK